MFIIIGLILLHLLFWMKNRNRFRELLLISSIIIIYSFLWMSFLEMEIRIKNYQEFYSSTTYGSDERIYWKAIVNATEWEKPPEKVINISGIGFIHFSSWILKNSPIQSTVLLRFVNILLYSLALNLLYILLLKRYQLLNRQIVNLDTSKNWHRKFLFYFILLSTNGILIWTVIRILKEPLIFFLLIGTIYAIYECFRQGNYLTRFFNLVIIFLFSYFMGKLRTGMEYITILIFFGSLASHRIFRQFAINPEKSWEKNFRKTTFLKYIFWGIGVIIFLIFIKKSLEKSIEYVLIYKDLFFNFFQNQLTNQLASYGLFGYIIGFFRFLLGPGPIRAVKQLLFGNVFVTSIPTGDYLIFIGSLQWWISLTFFVIFLIKKFRKNLLFFIILADFLIFLFFHIASYTFIYLGTGDTRHRALMYLFTLPFMIFNLTSFKYYLKLPTRRTLEVFQSVIHRLNHYN